ncbi:MAG: hypothetical protein QW328_08060 [Nitrososphaerota archaeon]
MGERLITMGVILRVPEGRGIENEVLARPLSIESLKIIYYTTHRGHLFITKSQASPHYEGDLDGRRG